MHMVAIIKCPAKVTRLSAGGIFFPPSGHAVQHEQETEEGGGNCGECPLEVLDEMSARGSYGSSSHIFGRMSKMSDVENSVKYTEQIHAS